MEPARSRSRLDRTYCNGGVNHDPMSHTRRSDNWRRQAWPLLYVRSATHWMLVVTPPVLQIRSGRAGLRDLAGSFPMDALLYLRVVER